MARNITLAVDEGVLKKVRRVAAEQNTTVNAMVRTVLEDIAARSTVERERREKPRHGCSK